MLASSIWSLPFLGDGGEIRPDLFVEDGIHFSSMGYESLLDYSEINFDRPRSHPGFEKDAADSRKVGDDAVALQ